jgi:osmotically-inducible protein OsmY
MTYGSDNQSQHNQDWSPNNYRGSSSSSFGQQNYYGQGSSQGFYGQGSSQGWSQPVRNDEAPQSGKSFYGKGPKGFKRSDERIREEASEALFRDHHVDASNIEVTVENGELVLSGTVESRRMKRLAEDCVESISGVNDVRNELRVQSQSSLEKSDRSGAEDSSSGDRSGFSDRSDKSKNRNTMSSTGSTASSASSGNKIM